MSAAKPSAADLLLELECRREDNENKGGLAEQTWETARGRRNRIAIAAPDSVEENAVSAQGLLATDDLLRFDPTDHEFWRVTFGVTLLPDHGCRFRIADILMGVDEPGAAVGPPLILRQEPGGRVARPSAQLASVGTGTARAGWRVKTTGNLDVPASIDDLRMLVVLPRGLRVRARFEVAASIEISSAFDRWSTLLFKRTPVAASGDYILPPVRRSTRKHTILLLAANPSGADPRALDREAREIQIELERAGHRDRFELVTRWAAEPMDLLREVRRCNPTIVHFCGRGDEQGRGLFFHGTEGRARAVPAAALQETFGAVGASVRVVVLSACYSEAAAEALLTHVDCVVGMRGTIGDAGARSFAVGFYGGLGEHASIAAAYRQGRAAIHLEGLPDGDRPQLTVRDGIDAEQMILTADAR